MSIVKEKAKRLIETDDWEDIMYKIYVRESIEQGLADIKNNKFLTEKEVKKRLSKWLN